MIAALYVDPRGPYPKIPSVECYDETRDARTYREGWPIVAHPPCGPWSGSRHLCRLQDRHAFAVALGFARLCGGVVEHPSGSRAFDAYTVPKPGDPPDPWGGYTIEVCQCEWGHVARKRTWLYLCRVPRTALEAPPYPGREPTHWVSGRRRRGGSSDGSLVPDGIKVCSPQQRRRTPPEFAAYLVRLAESSARAQAVA